MAATEPQDLVVPTPERVSFGYELAGLGSRFLAQIVDLLVLTCILAAEAALAVGGTILLGGSGTVAAAFLVAALLTFWGYFPVAEAVWSGQTLGKRALALRVVGDRGEPITVAQAVIRNLVRIVDFLPVYYAVGIVSIFFSSRAKRLGDFAAGTVVVRERGAVNLSTLLAAAEEPASGAASTPAWRPPGDPGLKRFVAAYSRQRPSLSEARRQQLAAAAEPALRAALPELVSAHGPLAALDQLADAEAG
jgi:uncharacterized RDD family membrane protein YckC